MKQATLLPIKSVLIALLFFTTVHNTSAQCPSGTLGVTGAGCGCLAGCNLTALGGPNCSPSVSGDCTGGQRNMSEDIVVPDGCTYTVTATMRPRSGGCSSSGGDSGDKMKVDISGGSKAFQSGSANATLDDSYTLAGPGTITVSGTANRADEIITYTTTFSGAACVNCMSALPVELTTFHIALENNAVACEWGTETEFNSDYFTVERSLDGTHFQPVAVVKGAGNSTNPNRYKIYDYDPYRDVVSYYRLAQTDFNGMTRRYEIHSIKPKKVNELSIFPNPSNGTVHITGDYQTLLASKLFDTSGREIAMEQISKENNELTVSALPVGVYTFVYFNNEQVISERIVVIP